MPNPYVQLPITTDPSELEDAAIAFLQAKWPDWVPNDADAEVIQIEALAPMAANAAQVAANMPAAAVIAFGTKLLGIPYGLGKAATADATFTVDNAEGCEIPAGAELDIDSVAFQTTSALVIPSGFSTGTVQVRANEVGEYANGLGGLNWAGVSLPVFVIGMVLSAATSGGSDQEDDEAYLTKIATELQLRSKSIITLPDFETVASELPGIGGAFATKFGTKPRNIWVYLKGEDGDVVPTAIKELLEAAFATTRMINAQVRLDDPVYDRIDVTYRLLALPEVDPADLLVRCNAALADALSPANWPLTGLPVVRVNKLLQVLSGVKGVDYVKSVQLAAADIGELYAPLTSGSAITNLNVASLASSELATLSTTLSTGGGAITSIPCSALKYPIPAGQTFRTTEGAFTQTWTVATTAEKADEAIAVASQVPSHNFLSGATKIEGLSRTSATKISKGSIVKLVDPTGAHTQELEIKEEVSTGVWKVQGGPNANYSYPIGTRIEGPDEEHLLAVDFTMPGIISLPEPGTMTGTIDTP